MSTKDVIGGGVDNPSYIYIYIYTRVTLSIYIDTNAELVASSSESSVVLKRVLVKKMIRLQTTGWEATRSTVRPNGLREISAGDNRPAVRS